MAAVVLQGSLQLAKQQIGVAAAASNIINHACYSSDVRAIAKPSLSQMRRGTGGRSSFNGVVATVFGASGFVGRYVCNELGKHGSQMILPYRGDQYDMMHLKPMGDLGQIMFHPFHLLDEASIRKAVKYSNVVVNLIGCDWETKNFKFDDVHVHGARRLAKISQEEGVEKFIHFSALNCNPNPKPMMVLKGSGILRSKFFGEQAVLEEFPNATIIRPSVIFGNEDRFISLHGDAARCWYNTFPMWKKGLETTKMPVCVEDLAKAVYAIIKDPESDGKIYQGVGPERFLHHELMKWIMAELWRIEPYYEITDIRFAPQYILRTLLFENLPGTPIGKMNREIYEREATDDKVDLSMPTLRDLGIPLTPLGEQITWLCARFRAYSYATEGVEDFEKITPATPLS